FNFNTEIEINSSPAGADVFINDIHYNQKTPCTITWEVGKSLAIALQHNGFEPLSGFAVNTIEGYDIVEDRRFWEMTVSNDKYKKYAINGIFKKKIVFETESKYSILKRIVFWAFLEL
ncbi:MAG: PEGA domain-containing protein, partial [bacterium]